MFFRVGTTSLMLLLAWITGCTPPARTHLIWEVRNNTNDTLLLTTYVPLDSVRVLAAALDSVRRGLAADTFPSGQARAALIRHQDQWYRVHPGPDASEEYTWQLNDRLDVARYSPATGGLTYRLWPYDLRVIGKVTMDGPYEVSGGPPFSRMTLQQGRARRTLTGQRQLMQAFRQQQARKANPHGLAYRYELVVEAGLAIQK